MNKVYFLLSNATFINERCSTARGSSTGFFLVGHTKVKAHTSFLFFCSLKVPLEVENKELLVDFVITLIK